MSENAKHPGRTMRTLSVDSSAASDRCELAELIVALLSLLEALTS